MNQLIRITTVPIQYELKVNNARLEYSRAKAELEISRNDGGLSIKSRPVKLNLDATEARNSVVPTTARSVAQTAQAGKEAAYSATAQLVQEGKLLLKADIGQDVIGQIMQQRTAPATGEFQLGFTPSAPVDINYEAADLTINYEMDKLNFDLKVANGNFEFIPGNIEMSITQHPDVVIEYVGGPLYVPPSADPNYEPIDVRA
ncbi:hypothetical protein GN277_00380 [Lachnospiraceae bacterium WCA-9-b2]|jgi:hypothetical protein|uniref:Uncharacterized protein n=3 Tax=Sporofaciens musculi TaxID=2681861 RepID=A0A7X3MCN2_9FIRM|nr:DUF6470 family protein [Sporofaciens musculi]MXP73954.1 hypothetical protein [Sporofaciens musculi]